MIINEKQISFTNELIWYFIGENDNVLRYDVLVTIVKPGHRSDQLKIFNGKKIKEKISNILFLKGKCIVQGVAT
jgi:hypothetical protein